MAVWYLVRYGLMGRVGRFASEQSGLERGQAVVIRSHRGTELGEVLIPVPATDDIAASAGPARVLRVADPDDLDRARCAERERAERFEVCRRVFADGIWPLELIDVESLLDDRRTVLHYLGPHHLDTSGLLSAFRSACNLDVMFEPAGVDVSDPDEVSTEHTASAHGCGNCGREGGCGTGGGCGTSGADAHGCASCGIKTLLAKRRAPALA
jgi:cell fate regulator YaaT (PSP1 superfamily)